MTVSRPVVRPMLAMAAAVAAMVLTFAVTARADQTTWTRLYFPSASCTDSIFQAGKVNFCRLAGNGRYLNTAVTRDSNLRTSGQDLYLDNYFVGNHNGNPANTLIVKNRFSAGNPIRLWTGTCYTGPSTLVNPGQSVVVSATNNLISFAAASASPC